MELKKRTIIWEENTEPPKNYYWIKPDNQVYEYSLEKRQWVVSEVLSYNPGGKDLIDDIEGLK
jgi:hypothetical protein